nr:hypothetical protein [Tanacetum cinerariifolium]
LQEALDACTALARRIEHLEHDKVAQDLEILKLKSRVKKLERANKGRITEESDKDEAAKVVNEEKETKEVRVNAADAQVEGRQAEIYHIDMDHAAKVLIVAASGTVSDAVVIPAPVHEAVEVVTTTKFITEVVVAASGTVTPVKVDVLATRRRGVIIRDPEEESSTNTPAETKSKDKEKEIQRKNHLQTLLLKPSQKTKKRVEEPKPMKKKQQVETDEAFTRKLQEEFNKEIDWEVAMEHVKQSAKESPCVLDYFKEMSYDDIRPIFEEKFNSNLKFLLKTKEKIEEEKKRAIAIMNETPAQKARKRRRLNEEAEDIKELKRHLEIIPTHEVYIETNAKCSKTSSGRAE